MDKKAINNLNPVSDFMRSCKDKKTFETFFVQKHVIFVQ